MKRLFLFFTFVILCVYTGLHFGVLPQRSQKKIFLYSVPKSGSHLAMKLIYLVTGQKPSWYYDQNKKENEYYWHHHPFPDEYEKYLHDPDYLLIVCMRDLRDVCVSSVKHLTESEDSWVDREAFSQLSFEEKLMRTITDINVFSPRGIGPNFLRIMQEPNVYTMHFEDLVGPEGGGSAERQKKVIREFAKLVKVCLSEQRVTEIAENLFGKKATDEFSRTFDKGLIGRWKRVFAQEHKNAFKEHIGSLLIELGYEKDNDW